MSLFSNADIESLSRFEETERATAGRNFSTSLQNAELGSFASLEKYLSDLAPGQTRIFYSDGNWSNYDMMQFLLEKSGPALVAFTTWSISEIAITRINEWISDGKVIDLYAVLDVGLRNRKPHIYQHALATLSKLKLAHIHAKVMAIIAPDISFLVIGSANFTKNPRKEAGVLICDRSEAEYAFEWVKNIFNGGGV